MSDTLSAELTGAQKAAILLLKLGQAVALQLLFSCRLASLFLIVHRLLEVSAELRVLGRIFGCGCRGIRFARHDGGRAQLFKIFSRDGKVRRSRMAGNGEETEQASCNRVQIFAHQNLLDLDEV